MAPAAKLEQEPLSLLTGKAAEYDSTLGHRASSGSKPHESYGSFVAYCFTVNYILGVGVLGMPGAFVKAGWLLSAVTLAIVSAMATLTALWLVEVVRRTAQIATARQLTLNRHLNAAEGLNEEVDQNIAVQQSLSRFYEMNELVDFHLGVPARRLYEVMIAIYFVGCLWSYASVFASSLASHIPVPWINGGQTCVMGQDKGCHSLYLFYVFVVCMVCVPLSCLKLTEMKLMQIVLAIFRFFSLGAMMITSVAMIWAQPLGFSTSATPPYYSDIKPMVWTGLGMIFPISIYAQIFHHSVSGLGQPLRKKNDLPWVFIAVVATTFLLYTMFGFTVGLYFGSAVNSTCTLNWANYGELHNNAWWAVFLSYLIVLFPPIDIISAYPLNAITLGNNLLTCFVTDPVKQKQRKNVIVFRLIAAVPPLIGTMFENDLAAILQYTGCIGVIIAFLFPVALEYRSNETMRRMIKRHEFTHCSWFNRNVGNALAIDEDEHTEEVLNANRVLPGVLGSIVNSMPVLIAVAVFSAIGLIAVIVLSFTGKADAL